MWQRWNSTTHIFEKSSNDGASWTPLGLSADIITEGALAKLRQHAQTPYKDEVNVFSVTQKIENTGPSLLLSDTAAGTDLKKFGLLVNSGLFGIHTFTDADGTIIPLIQVNRSGEYQLGVKFPATQIASSNANTFDDYEEGTWTPTDASGAGLSITTFGGTPGYIKAGQLVVAWGNVIYPATVSTANALIGGLPFTCQAAQYSGAIGFSTYATGIRALVQTSSATFSFYNWAGTALTNTVIQSTLHACTLVYRATA